MPKAKEEVKEEVVEKKSTKTMKLTASFKQKNEEDGTFERVTFTGEGATLADAVAKMEGYPKGLACNILVTLERNGKEYQRNLAPSRARAILEDADENVFEFLFKGI